VKVKVKAKEAKREGEGAYEGEGEGYGGKSYNLFWFIFWAGGCSHLLGIDRCTTRNQTLLAPCLPRKKTFPRRCNSDWQWRLAAAAGR
jgi:hypothetical protein